MNAAQTRKITRVTALQRHSAKGMPVLRRCACPFVRALGVPTSVWVAAYRVNQLYDVRRRRLMADPIEDIIGDYRAFAEQQRDRLATRGIDITPYALSHLAY